ncbi:hypothetical protein DPMN_164035 [Dreissena polymorpha]|uniref:Uncharacterized protein n=1 Tax=Dreissena polymorpha TaxID=45954 RepID=A0A9D4EUF1_DREPO|nr:hypothetical protein DPMN_164035 [Dreissena polymorpha]
MWRPVCSYYTRSSASYGEKINSNKVERGLPHQAFQEKRLQFLLQLPRNHTVVHLRKGV